MTAPFLPTSRIFQPNGALTRARIVSAFREDGKNTCAIARELGVHEAAVVEVLRQERDARVRKSVGRRG